MNHQYYSNDQQRSLSSTTQYSAAAAQYAHYPQGHHAASSSFTQPQQYYPSPEAQQMAYMAQQDYAQVPSSHPMVNSTSYPGGSGQQAVPLTYADPRGMSSPGGLPTYPEQSQDAAHYSQYPSQYPQQAAHQQMHVASQRYSSSPVQALQHGHPVRRHSPSSTSPTMHYNTHPHSHVHPSYTTSSHQGQLPPSPGAERFPCDKCDKTFSRSHDRKRHYESQHSPHPTSHLCRYCRKDFSRADSMKRHVDNGCEKDPSYACS